MNNRCLPGFVKTRKHSPKAFTQALVSHSVCAMPYLSRSSLLARDRARFVARSQSLPLYKQAISGLVPNFKKSYPWHAESRALVTIWWVGVYSNLRGR